MVYSIQTVARKGSRILSNSRGIVLRIAPGCATQVDGGGPERRVDLCTNASK